VFTPEAKRAVIGVTVALDFFSTVLAGEVFYFSLEVFGIGHWFYLITVGLRRQIFWLRGRTSFGYLGLLFVEYVIISSEDL